MNDNAMFAFQLQDQTKSLNKTSDQAEFHLSAQQEEVHAGNYRYVFASAANQELNDLVMVSLSLSFVSRISSTQSSVDPRPKSINQASYVSL